MIKRSIGTILGLLVGVILGLVVYVVLTELVFARGKTNKTWSKPVYGICEVIEDISCGSISGVRTVTVTCIEDKGEDIVCSLGTKIEATYVCPIIAWEYFDHIVKVPYDKLSDPTKCHRPSDKDLKDIYEMGKEEIKLFKKDNHEWKDAEIDVVEHYINPETKVTTEECVLEVPDYRACDLEGQCPEECGYEGGVVADGKGGEKQCLTTSQCVTEILGCTDETANNYNAEANKDDGSCAFDQKETKPSDPWNCSMNNSCPQTNDAPQCTDGNTVKLPANPHVLRSGTKATVNWFQTEGNEANIYFKEVDSKVWTHSVRDIKITGGYGSVIIDDLKPNLGYTFGIEQKQGCAGGQLVIAVIVDGPAPQKFNMTYWEWGK